VVVADSEGQQGQGIRAEDQVCQHAASAVGFPRGSLCLRARLQA
jgi:hypothetical protein